MNLERFERAGAAPTGRAAIVVVVNEILGGGAGESRVWIAFTSRASVDRAAADTMRRAIRVWVARWAELVVRGQGDGSIRTDVEPIQVASELHALVNGLRLQAVFASGGAPASWVDRVEQQLVFLRSLATVDAESVG